MRFWENEGKPLNDGRLCLVIDPEDGTHPIRTYGRTREEVLEKVSKTVEEGQKYIGKLRMNVTAPKPNGTAAAQPAPVPAASTKLSPEDIMTATADMSGGNPAKAAEAAVKLVQHATGVDLKALGRQEAVRRFGAIAQAWEAQHPEFPNSPTNTKLLTNQAALDAGGLDKITVESMNSTYLNLQQQGFFVDDEGSASETQGNPTPHVPAGEIPTSRTVVRPRGATSYRSSSFRGAAVVDKRTPKYSRAEIDAMSSGTLLEKMRNEPGFSELVATYQQPKSQRAQA
jgi:hypothetical protein